MAKNDTKEETTLAQGAEDQVQAGENDAPQTPVVKENRVRIILRRSDRDKGKKHQEVGLNDKVHMVPFDVEVAVLPGVAEILRNSLIDEMVELDDGSRVVQQVSRFALQILG